MIQVSDYELLWSYDGFISLEAFITILWIPRSDVLSLDEYTYSDRILSILQAIQYIIL